MLDSFPAAESSASRSTTSTRGFRNFARRRSTSSRPASGPRPTGAPLPRPSIYVPLAAGAERAQSGGGAGGAVARRGESRRLHYLSVPPNAALSAVRMLGEAGLVERSRIIMEKPFGTDLASAVSLNAKLHEVFARRSDLPHRSLPRQGAGAEHPRVPLRQRPVRADLEPQFHRSRADRRAGDAGPRQARRFLRDRPAPIATWW